MHVVEESDGGASLKGHLILLTLDGRHLPQQQVRSDVHALSYWLVAGGGVGVGYGAINVPFPFCSLGNLIDKLED